MLLQRGRRLSLLGPECLDHFPLKLPAECPNYSSRPLRWVAHGQEALGSPAARHTFVECYRTAVLTIVVAPKM